MMLTLNYGDPVAQPKYAQIIDSVFNLMNSTRPDVAYVVCRLGRYTHNLNNEHWFALNRLMKYLRGTMNYDIMCCGFSSTLEGYCDATWIFDSDETKFASGYVFTLSGCAIS